MPPEADPALNTNLVDSLAPLMALQPQILAQRGSVGKSRGLAFLSRNAHELKRRLSGVYKSFLRNSYRRYLDPAAGCEVKDPVVVEMRDDLVNRFESITRPDVREALDIIKSFIGRCKESGREEVGPWESEKTCLPGAR